MRMQANARMARSGGCLCGGVRYQIDGPMRPVVYCHCLQCQKTSGHFVAASACAIEDLVMIADETLCWYQSSPLAERGFCGKCGGNLFWRPRSREHVSIMAGTLDRPTKLQAIAHIYTATASDFFSIADGLPKYADGGPGNYDEI